MGYLRQGNLCSPDSAQTSQEGPDPAPTDCRAPRDCREERRNSALVALLQEVLNPRQKQIQVL